MKQILILSAAMLLLQNCTDMPPDGSPESQLSEAETEVIYDEIDYTRLKDYTFYAFRTPEPADSGEAWLTADKWVPVWNLEPETDYPEGTFVKIVADVTILNGGEAGYCNEPQIESLRNMEPITYAEVLPKCEIPAEDTPYNEIARRFFTNESYYIIYKDETIYRDGEKLGRFPDSDLVAHEMLRPYYECPFLLDYIAKDTLLSFEEHADVIVGGQTLTPLDTLAVGDALYTIFEHPDEYIIDTNAEILNARQIAASRESGIYVMCMEPFCVRIDDDYLQFRWASVCSETTDDCLTATFDGMRSVRLKNEAKELILEACKQ